MGHKRDRSRGVKPTPETWRRYCAACDLARFLGLDDGFAPEGSTNDKLEHQWRGLYEEQVLKVRTAALEQRIASNA